MSATSARPAARRRQDDDRPGTRRRPAREFIPGARADAPRSLPPRRGQDRRRQGPAWHDVPAGTSRTGACADAIATSTATGRCGHPHIT